jgi:hypothetical protein
MTKDRVRRIEYRYVTVPDVPGAEYALVEHLADREVDLFAYLAFPLPGGRGQIDLFAKDPAALDRAVAASGLSLSPRREALFVEGTDRPGALASHLAKVAAKGIQVVASTAVAVPGGGYGFLVFVKQDRLDEAMEALLAPDRASPGERPGAAPSA